MKISLSLGYFVFPTTVEFVLGNERQQLSRQQCSDRGGTIVYDRGDGSIHRPGYLCTESGNPPIATVIPLPGEPIPREGSVCCESGVLLGGDKQARPEITRQGCVDDLGGNIVGDIGDGSIFQESYNCNGGRPPVANIKHMEGEPIATEGEACCDPSIVDSEIEDILKELAPDWKLTHGDDRPQRPEITREMCIDLPGGKVVGDIGDGSIFRTSYTCDGSGRPPVANIAVVQEEIMAVEGEVCCATSIADSELQDMLGQGSPSSSADINSHLSFAAFISFYICVFAIVF